MISLIFTFSLQGLDDALPQGVVEAGGGRGAKHEGGTVVEGQVEGPVEGLVKGQSDGLVVALALGHRRHSSLVINPSYGYG